MQRRALLVLATMAGVLPCTLTGQAPEAPWYGTWKLNLAKSTYNPGPSQFKRTTCKIEPWEDGVKVTYDMVRTRGGIAHLEWTGKFDGRDYPVQGVDFFVTNSYRRIDDRTYQVVVKVDDEVSATSTVAISRDGKTITTVTTVAPGKNGQNSTTVYDKQ